MVTYFLKILLNKFFFHIFLYFITITYEQECPKDFPIYNTIKQNCTLEYCTESQFLNETCIIANNYAKIRWINKKTVISESNNSQIYPTVAWDDDNNLLFETTTEKKNKVFVSLETDGNPYKKEFSRYEVKKTGNDNFLYNIYPKSFLTTFDSHRFFYSLSSQESLGIFDLDEKKYTEKIFEDVLGYKIRSNINSLLKTRENNVFIYAYITLGNRLAMQKIQFIKDDIQVIKTVIEDKKTIPRNSRKCEIFIRSSKEIVECIDMDEQQVYYIRLYNSDLNFIDEYKLVENYAPREKAFYSYNEIYYISDSSSLFIVYNDVPENGAKPFIYWKNYNGKNMKDIVTKETRYQLFKDFDYYFSDVDNALTSLAEAYCILATMTYEKRLMITLIDIVGDIIMFIYYLDIPLKDLYNINYFSNLYAFPYNGRFGIGFIEEINNSNNNIKKYQSSYILFHFANTTDLEPVNNIFSFYNKINNTLYTINPYDYINFQNNLFCYNIKTINIIEYPDPDTGIEILVNTSKNVIKNVKSYSSKEIAKTIIISYKGEINEITKGNYELIFEPLIEELEKTAFINSLSKSDSYYVRIPGLNWDAEIYKGRHISFKFTVGNCYNNCLTCNEESNNDLDQKCTRCLKGYYFKENTTNCYNYTPKGYFFDKEKKIYSQCYDTCNTCNGKGNRFIHNCASCIDKDYILYNNTNCLKCKSLNLYANYEQTICIPYIPVGYYLNDSETNTIDKCHKNCYTCNQGRPDDNNMNCIFCADNVYPIENTNNCELSNYEGYYLDDDLILKKCHPFCKTCKKGSIGDNMNCESCDDKLGYFFNKTNNLCEFKAIEHFYYVPENDSYLPCFEKCLTCYDKEIITINEKGENIIMNCLSCNETEGYFLSTKSGNNCLRCKSENKYVNFEETDCIDELPEGFYLSNNKTNQIDQCYPKCKTCSEKGFSDNNMKCDSCYKDQGFFLLKGNCVKSMSCDSYFYYKSNLEESTELNMEKICLNDKNECPNSLPFYSTNSKECTNRCDLDTFFGEGCKIANFEQGFNLILNLILNEYRTENFEKIVSLYNNYSEILIIEIKLFNYERDFPTKIINLEQNIKRIDSEEYLKLPRNSKFIEQEININECIKKLENNNITNSDTKLRMLKIDINNMNTTFSQYYFQLFDINNNFEKLNLSLCNALYNNISINIEKIISQKKSQNNDNVNNINKKYNSDKCSVTYDDNGADILIEDRIVLNNEELNMNNNIKLYLYEICPINCTLINFDKKDFISYCSCPLLNSYINNDNNIIFDYHNNNNDINNNNKEKNTYIVIKDESSDIDIENRNDKITIESKANIQYMKCINMISKQFKNNYVLIIMTLFDIGYLVTLLLYCIHFRKIYINPKKPILKDNKIGIKNIKGSTKNSYTNFRIFSNPPPKSRDIKLKKNMFSSVNSDIQSINNNNNNDNKYNRNKRSVNNYAEELTNRQNYYSYNKKNTKTGIDIDLDFEEYKIVLEKDKRTCINIFISLTKKKQIFILAFKNDNYFKLLKISLLLFCFINYFTTNVFLFTDKVIHQIYLDKGDYNSNYQIKNVFLSAFISSLFLWVSKIIFLVKKSDKHIIYYLKFVDWFYVIFMLLLIFYWLYVGSYTSVFIKSQKHLSFNFLLTIVICILYEFILTIISVILRLIAVKNRNSPMLYKFSVFLILLKG